LCSFCFLRFLCCAAAAGCHHAPVATLGGELFVEPVWLRFTLFCLCTAATAWFRNRFHFLPLPATTT
jgi:hypothetical protein